MQNYENITGTSCVKFKLRWKDTSPPMLVQFQPREGKEEEEYHENTGRQWLHNNSQVFLLFKKTILVISLSMYNQLQADISDLRMVSLEPIRTTLSS